ncbi:hypothetical protein CQA40_08680, partial [Helicobacter sp. MIT 01-3238]
KHKHKKISRNFVYFPNKNPKHSGCTNSRKYVVWYIIVPNVALDKNILLPLFVWISKLLLSFATSKPY